MGENNSKISRREFLRVAGLGAGATLLVACAAPTPEVIEKVVKETVMVEKEVVVEKVVTATPPPEPTKLRLGHWWGDSWDYVNEIAQEKTNTIVTIEPTAGAEYADKMLLGLAAGTAPDLIFWGNSEFYKLWPTGRLLPFDDYLEPNNFDVSKHYWDPVVVGGYKGKILGLDLHMAQGKGIFVNKTLTDELGISDMLPMFGQDNFDTWHYEDLVEFCQAAEQRRSDGTVDRYGLGNSMMFRWDFDTRIFVYSNGGQQFDIWWYEGDETKCLLDSPEAIEAISKMVDLTRQGYTYYDPGNVWDSAAYKSGERAVAHWHFMCTVAIPQDSIPFEQIYLHEPWFTKRAASVSGDCITVNKDTKYPDVAMTYAIANVADVDVGRAYIRKIGIPPAYDPKTRFDELEEGSPEWVTSGIVLSRWEGYSEYPEHAKDAIHYPGHTGFKAPDFVRETMRSALEAALAGQVPTEKAVKDAVAEINKELAART